MVEIGKDGMVEGPGCEEGMGVRVRQSEQKRKPKIKKNPEN